MFLIFVARCMMLMSTKRKKKSIAIMKSWPLCMDSSTFLLIVSLIFGKMSEYVTTTILHPNLSQNCMGKKLLLKMLIFFHHFNDGVCCDNYFWWYWMQNIINWESRDELWKQYCFIVCAYTLNHDKLKSK